MKKLLVSLAVAWSSLTPAQTTLAQTSVTEPLISLELPLVDLLDHLEVRAWRFGVTTLPGTTLSVGLVYHQRNSEGDFDPDLEIKLGQKVVGYNDVGPQTIAVIMSPDTTGTRVTIKLNDTTSYQSVEPVELAIFETSFGAANGTSLSPNQKGEYVLLAHYKTEVINGVSNITATGNVDDMVSYVSLNISVE